jgi:hypothetical protein
MDAVKVIDEGYTFSGLPDGDTVRVLWAGLPDDRYVEIIITEQHGQTRSFDLDGFRDYVEGLKIALDYAENTQERNTRS